MTQKLIVLRDGPLDGSWKTIDPDDDQPKLMLPGIPGHDYEPTGQFERRPSDGAEGEVYRYVGSSVNEPPNA